MRETLMRINPLRHKLATGQTTYGMWVTLESPNVTEAAVAVGLDWIVIEMEHGHLDWRAVADHVRTTSGTDTAAVIRVSEIQRSNVQRALDIGADGIILPMVGNAESLETAFQFGRFPPRGVRGVGGERSVKWGLDWDDYLRDADRETLIIPLLETRDAVENIDSILAIHGLETIFFGPADMSASYGYLGQWEGPGVAEAILRVRAKAAEKGIFAGILGRNTEEVQSRREQGFQMIGLGADVNLMIRSLQQTLASVR
jgi:2-keto-3-deoxy-L-rhamnonate aldolase RhmA